MMDLGFILIAIGILIVFALRWYMERCLHRAMARMLDKIEKLKRQ